MTESSSAETHRVVATSEHGRYLSCTQRWSYAVGHVFNDLCGAFWFTYLLVFMKSVNGFSGQASGNLMLIGQVADGVATPFIGIECDKKLDWWICKYGRRKTWHLFGSICVFLSFPFLFNRCIQCTDSPEMAQIFYYSAFIIVFQFGWASVQIAHMALVTDLTPISSERVELNAYRYAFTVFANVTVYVMMWIILGVNHNTEGRFNVNDSSTFRDVAFMIMGIGTLFSLIFHIGVKEKVRCNRDNIINDPNGSRLELVDNEEECLRWYHWFKETQFWTVALVYMGTRLTINLTQVYLVNYLQDTLRLDKSSGAYIPLVVYVSGFAFSFLMKRISVRLGKRLTFLIGAIMALGACSWIFIGNSGTFYTKYEIFAVAVLLGISSTTLLVTSLSITSDLIGQNVTSGAFVFGSMSFFDKVSNGLSVMFIETFKPCIETTELPHACDWYYRDIMSIVCGGAVMLAMLGLTFQRKKKIGMGVRRSPTPIEGENDGDIVYLPNESTTQVPYQHPGEYLQHHTEANLTSPLLEEYEYDSS